MPTLHFVLALDEARARTLTMRLLMDDPCHQAIEVREGGNVVFVQTRPIGVGQAVNCGSFGR